MKPITVQVNGVAVSMTAKPYITQSVTMVPFRAIFEALSLKVEWDKSKQTVSGSNAWSRMELKVGSLAAKVNGNQIRMQTPAEIKDGAVYVPLRFIGEETGNRVTWNAAARNIDIRTGNTIKGRVYTADGVGSMSGKHIQLLQRQGDKLLDIAEVLTGPNGDFRFDGLEIGSDYFIEGNWTEDSDIVTCAFRFRVSGNCARLGVVDRQATVRVLSPDGDPMIDNELNFTVSENDTLISYLGQQQNEYITNLLQDGHTYTISAQLPPAWSERFAVPAPYTFTYHAGEKVKHEFILSTLLDAPVIGRVTDDTGKPLARFRVLISLESDSSNRESVISGQDGSFSLRGLEAGHAYLLYVDVNVPFAARGKNPAIGDLIPPLAQKFTYDGTTLDLGNVKLNRIQMIGKVVNGEGKPQFGIPVLQDAKGKDVGNVVFTKSGYVAVGGMNEGETYTWKVYIGDFTLTKEVTKVTKGSWKAYTFVYKPGLEEHTFTGD
ncbi:stalk domain-containing protein [Paenibacillus sp. BC26]|uniref:stalk domain-containing protein n=1 Tax=Paenibacillus sp. BC26 TaxID=1881032 RepID=UPI0015A52F4A|nr:stalk domain-containing protein [Paenibacillus sp. BC26]